jgi:hypothetical protein
MSLKIQGILFDDAFAVTLVIPLYSHLTLNLECVYAA